jgi:hypothetical protein
MKNENAQVVFRDRVTELVKTGKDVSSAVAQV